MAGALQGLRKASLKAARGATASSWEAQGTAGDRSPAPPRPRGPPAPGGPASRRGEPPRPEWAAGARVPAAAMATRTQFENSPDVGVFSLLTNRYCLCALGSAENVSGERAGAGAAGRL